MNIFLAAGVVSEDGPVGWPTPKLHLESFMQKVLSPYQMSMGCSNDAVICYMHGYNALHNISAQCKML